MTRKQQAVTLPGGLSLTVWEANWDISMARAEIEEQAKADRARLNGTGDKTILFFQEFIYSGLCAASVGDVPDLESAYRLSTEDLDAWHLAVAAVNPGWYTTHEYQQEELQLGARKMTVLSLRPSVIMRRVRLESEVEKEPPLGNVRQETFRVIYYPKLAACSLGDVPTSEESRVDLSMDELDAWYETASRMIPDWFVPLAQQADANKQAAESAKKNKPRRKRK